MRRLGDARRASHRASMPARTGPGQMWAAMNEGTVCPVADRPAPFGAGEFAPQWCSVRPLALVYLGFLEIGDEAFSAACKQRTVESNGNEHGSQIQPVLA